jgi:signal transduction histidine kinase
VFPFFGPLHLAGYIACLAVAIGIWRESVTWHAPGGLPARAVALAFLGIFLAGFALLGPTGADRPNHRRRIAVVVSVLIATTFGLMALGVSNVTAILLIMIAVVLASNYGPRLTAATLLLVNVGFYGIAHWLWHVTDALFLVLIYGSFEAFAAVSSSARTRSEAAAVELRRVNAELLATRALLAESARDSERLRVSRELHDVTGHKLTALNLNLELLRHDSELSARRELAIASQLGDELLSDIRAVVSRLRHDDGIDLREALQRLAEPFPQPSILIDVHDGLRVRSTATAEVLLRAAQEGLTNSVRHAGAQHAWVSLRPGPDRIELIVEDDGPYTGSHTAGNGLTGLRERVEGLGGRVGIDRSNSGGFRLTVFVPARSPG